MAARKAWEATASPLQMPPQAGMLKQESGDIAMTQPSHENKAESLRPSRGLRTALPVPAATSRLVPSTGTNTHETSTTPCIRFGVMLTGLAAGLLVANCAGILGADFDRELRPDEDSGVGPDQGTGDEHMDATAPMDAVDAVLADWLGERNPADGEAATDAGGSADAVVDSADAVVDVEGGQPIGEPPVCGDMSGLQAGAPWPMENYCPTRPSRGPHPFASGRRLRWATTFDAHVATSPVVAADGTAYVGTLDSATNASKMRAVSSTGDVTWSFPTDGYAISPAAIGADGTVYFASFSTLYAVHPTGTLSWSRAIGGYAVSLTIGPTGRLYAGTYQGNVLAVDLSDGGVAWSVDAPGIAMSPVAIGLDGNLYVASIDQSAGYLISLQRDGSLRWSVPLAGIPASGNVGALPPSIDANGLIYVVEYPNTAPVLRAFRSDSTQAFELPLGGHATPPGSPVVGGHNALFSDLGSSAVAFDTGGSVMWTRTFGGAFTAPAVAGVDNEVCSGAVATGEAGLTAQLVCFDADGNRSQGFDSLMADTGLESVFGTAAVGGDGTIYVGLDLQLLAVGD